MSRKHAIDVDSRQQSLSIFGGKLTDCINVGEEVCAIVENMGVALPDKTHKWYGEPPPEVREAFFQEAARLGLDDLTAPSASEKLSSRFWRRYGAEAFSLLEPIRRNPEQAQLLIAGTEYTRCEIDLAARREMIVKLEDFLRRRSKIAQIMRPYEIRQSPGLREACEIFFGDQASAKIDEYFQTQGAIVQASPASLPRRTG